MESEVDSKGVSCPKSSRVFNAALVMLDFSGVKKILVRLCPCCNFALDSSEDN